mmetsp:Transcript_4616/g.9416  ORF Transcript_4616/g.9416 Transcript_4616/m.9416 type:complete len:109 (+) Transcript_4616:44-370(+)|eukprot:CAMPEP_0202810148 /NCGR_PEP_ID=MMETSP1389-20130828/2331_1 /ASSEMBLY_ACC=CAM_ASM_000865 /TAXON_ID=302021 /ORGANISM="Rhodomonas sp., Strain CCMP768" /LENGTH=108 /DNA_ID=CAMNT_0049480967 /DNA_START=26 /DNA_END=352 /DNA_ORIENTATION=-
MSLKSDPQAAANFTFPSDDPNDPMAVQNQRDSAVRESWVKIMSARELRDAVRECYRKEGVNFPEKCKPIAMAYMEAIKQPQFSGGIGKQIENEKAKRAAHAAAAAASE